MIIIDASVAAKWLFKNEQDTKRAKEILESHIAGEDKIIVPDLFFYEIANMAVTKGYLSSQRTIHFLTKIYEAQLTVYSITESNVKEAAKLAKKYKTSVYDMLYAVVAKTQKTNLITADEQFIKQTGFKFVKPLKSRLFRSPSPAK